MLDGKVEGCILTKDIQEEIEDGITIFKQTVDLEEFSGENMEIVVGEGTVSVTFDGVEMECPKERVSLEFE